MSGSRASAIAILGFAFVALATIVSGPNELTVDHWLRDVSLIESGALATVATTIAWTMRTAPVGLICLSAGIWFALSRRRADALLILLVFPLMHASIVLKDIVASPRPDGAEGDWGFPAGRVGNAVLLGSALVLASAESGRGRWAVAGIWVCLVSWARLATGSQWATDILGAWLWTVPVVLALATLRSAMARNGFRTQR